MVQSRTGTKLESRTVDISGSPESEGPASALAPARRRLGHGEQRLYLGSPWCVTGWRGTHT